MGEGEPGHWEEQLFSEHPVEAGLRPAQGLATLYLGLPMAQSSLKELVM